MTFILTRCFGSRMKKQRTCRGSGDLTARPLGADCMSCHVWLRASVRVSVWLTVSFRETQQVWTAGMCAASVWCAYIYFRETDAEEWHIRINADRVHGVPALHSDWVQRIIQHQEEGMGGGAETPGIDSQAAGQRDRQTGMCTQEAHAHLHANKQQRQQLSVTLAVQLRMIHTLYGCGVFCCFFFSICAPSTSFISAK